MTEYNYIALDKTGKQQKGSLVAETERFALEQLRSEGLYPTQLRKSTLLTKDLDLHIGSKVSTRDISVFCRQFASMLAAGVTILEALSMLEQQSENKHLVEALGDVRQDIMKGETLAVAMRRQAEVFPALMLNMVAAGEEAGKLEMTFSRMAARRFPGTRARRLLRSIRCSCARRQTTRWMRRAIRSCAITLVCRARRMPCIRSDYMWTATATDFLKRKNAAVNRSSRIPQRLH